MEKLIMTNAQELFDEWHDNTYGVKPSFNRNHEGSSHWDGDKQDRWEAWQACQAHNDAVTAELREDLLDLRTQVNYRCSDVQRLTEKNIELVQALQDMFKELGVTVDFNHNVNLYRRIDALIAKHKKG